MRILVIDDETHAAELTAELLCTLDAEARRISTVIVAYDLQSAIDSIDEYRPDAVLCDANIPETAGARPRAFWSVIAGECMKHNAGFVLYSGDVCEVEQARRIGHAAFVKPSRATHLYEALVGPPERVPLTAG